MRYIHIFISSTFSDMHRERDLLHQIAGLINRDLSHQGYRIILRDLRYGVDTSSIVDETEIEKKVLKECFDAIDQCQLFVLLLGDRYGSVFDDLTVPKRYMPDQELNGKSVTHLEVQYAMQQIPQKNIRVFQRVFQGDSFELPLHYRENEAGARNVQALKESLLCQGYGIDDYDAHMKDGVFTIDEYRFLKHGQGFIQNMVFQYIRNQIDSPSKEQEISDALVSSEQMSEILLEEIQKKVQRYPISLQKVATELIRLRIEELLHQQDYDRINQLGSGGDVILEYRRRLIQDLPDHFVGLLHQVCKSISIVVDPELDVYKLLLALATAQQSELFQLGGISIHEILSLIVDKVFQVEPTWDQWISFRQESSGTYCQQLPAQRALASFLGQDALLSYSPAGYSFCSDEVVRILSASAPISFHEAVMEYSAHIYWYLPDPIRAWFRLLTSGRFELALSCLLRVQMNRRFTDKFLAYIDNFADPKEIIALLEQFLNWMVDTDAGEATIMYLLKLCNWVINRMDDEFEDLYYQDVIIPLYQRIYHRHYTRNHNQLTIVRQCFLRALYEEIAYECPERILPSLTASQREQASAIDEAIFELMIHHELSEEADFEGYMRMVNDLAPYVSCTDEFIQLMRMYVVQNRPSWGCLCENLVLMGLGNQLMGRDELCHILHIILEVQCYDDTVFDVLEALNQNLVEFAYAENDTELGILSLMLIRYLAEFETYLRRAEWCCWAHIISYDVIWKFRCQTNDETVRMIADMKEEQISWDFEELCEIDQSIMKETENYYAAVSAQDWGTY